MLDGRRQQHQAAYSVSVITSRELEGNN
jgi:hypothetical protein